MNEYKGTFEEEKQQQQQHDKEDEGDEDVVYVPQQQQQLSLAEHISLYQVTGYDDMPIPCENEYFDESDCEDITPESSHRNSELLLNDENYKVDIPVDDRNIIDQSKVQYEMNYLM